MSDRKSEVGSQRATGPSTEIILPSGEIAAIEREGRTVIVFAECHDMVEAVRLEGRLTEAARAAENLTSVFCLLTSAAARPS